MIDCWTMRKSQTDRRSAAELFRANFARLVADRGITLYRVARDLEVSTKNVYGLADGSRLPRLDTLDRLAAYFSVPVTEFFSDAS